MSFLSDLINRLRQRLKPKPTLPPVTPTKPTPGPTPVPGGEASEAELAILTAGRTFRYMDKDEVVRTGVRSILEGQTHEVVLKEARAYAQHMAEIGRQDDHAGFSERWARIRKVLPGFLPVEISAESWGSETLSGGADSLFEGWKQSPGHWEAANGPAQWIGYSMAKGKSRWYGCGIILT